MAKLKTTFDRHLGVKTVSIKKGFCKIKLDLKQNLLNEGDIVHGGVLATLCDIALAGAITHAMKKDEWCVTAQLNIEYLYPAFPGESLFAYGKLVKKGNTLAFVEGGIETKSKKLIARAQGIWVIKKFPAGEVPEPRIQKVRTLG